MAPPPSTSPSYFLGIAGEQSGPFSEADLISRIRQGLVPQEALLWHEGLPDWKPISQFPAFREALSEAFALAGGVLTDLTVGLPSSVTSSPGLSRPANPMPASGPKRAKPKTRFDDDFQFTFAADDTPRPVFRPSWIRLGLSKLGGMFIVAVFAAMAAAGAVFFFLQTEEKTPQKARPLASRSRRAKAEADLNKKPSDKAAMKAGTAENSARREKLRLAQSELLLKPEASLAALRILVLENATDNVGKEALEVATTYYRQYQRPQEAGRLLMEAKQPEEAVKYFLGSDPSYPEAEEALFSAYQASKGSERREWLVKDIELLIGPLGKMDLAVERIRLLERDFPKQPHPFRFYLKSEDEKIADLFTRVSFHFVQTLMQFFSTEFPGMALAGRPVAEVVKGKDARYRIVGKYRGEIVLNRDKLRNIEFLLWLHQDSWYLVDTNLTEERKRFSRLQRNKLRLKSLSATEALSFLTNVFRQKFPKSALHEKVSLRETAKSGAD